jgi:hypothetical protein
MKKNKQKQNTTTFLLLMQVRKQNNKQTFPKNVQNMKKTKNNH